jgi:hypothetical protein
MVTVALVQSTIWRVQWRAPGTSRFYETDFSQPIFRTPIFRNQGIAPSASWLRRPSPIWERVGEWSHALVFTLARVEAFGSKLGPRLLYPVWVKDGRQELVRGASFGVLETRVGCGDRVVASILFDRLEPELSPIKQEKLPEYPVPPLSQG